jgi:hypothetical protein
MKILSYPQRVACIGIVATISIAFVFFLPPLPQDPAYHQFADQRPWLGIANFGDVAGNFVFLLTGIAGMLTAWRNRGMLPDSFIWMTFFLGVFLTGIGSGYYHLAPDNHTLVWDRLPMTIAFMALFPLIIAERIHRRAGKFLFPLFLAIGIGSVWYWNWTENTGHGDLRLYALVQFLPLLIMLLTLALFPARHAGTKYLLYTFGWYILAKLLEHFDPAVFTLTGEMASGHTLKHIAAAIGTGCMIFYMRNLTGQTLQERHEKII